MIHIEPHILAAALQYYTDLHRQPELSFREYRTSQYICHVLEQSGIRYSKAGGTGVIGFLPGKNSSVTVALRADMDALPVTENTAHQICSQSPGIMHACGHDLHTACLLGAAMHLSRQEDRPVNVMFIFQHAEEVLPGGAADILSAPFFKAHFPDWIIGLHAEPELQVGYAGICPGQYMASGDEIYITLHGPGGHAAMPEKTADLVLIASQIVVSLQQITSRKASPLIPTVLTFGNVRCESTMNIIPRKITLEGTFRTFDETWRTRAKGYIREIAYATAESMGATCEVSITEGYPSLYNDPGKAHTVIRLLEKEWGKDKVILLPQRMTTEDFARYSRLIPATFIRLGVCGQEKSGRLHTPDFCADIAAIEKGIQIFALLTAQPL